MPIELPATPIEQQEAWHAVFEIHSRMPQGWVLVGGQAVYLHAIERSAPVVRATTDADFALDIRAYPQMLHNFTSLFEEARFRIGGRRHWKATSTGGSAEKPSWMSSFPATWGNGQPAAVA